MNELNESEKALLAYLFIKYPRGLPWDAGKIYTTMKVWNELTKDANGWEATILGGGHIPSIKSSPTNRPRSKWYSCETGITEEGLKVIKELSDEAEGIQ